MPLGQCARYRERLVHTKTHTNTILPRWIQRFETLDPPCFFRIFKEQPKKMHCEESSLPAAFLCREGPGGANRDRTGDLLLAKQALSQLSYGPCLSKSRSSVGSCFLVVGLGGLEPPTPALSRRCSNQLSYRPVRLRYLDNR
jgi:hypothetical protein